MEALSSELLIHSECSASSLIAKVYRLQEEFKLELDILDKLNLVLKYLKNDQKDLKEVNKSILDWLLPYLNQEKFA